jgi:heme exporter protein D
MEVAVAGALVVIAVAAMLTVPSVRAALRRVLRWRRREERIEDGA